MWEQVCDLFRERACVYMCIKGIVAINITLDLFVAALLLLPLHICEKHVCTHHQAL